MMAQAKVSYDKNGIALRAGFYDMSLMNEAELFAAWQELANDADTYTASVKHNERFSEIDYSGRAVRDTCKINANKVRERLINEFSSTYFTRLRRLEVK